MPFAIAKVMKKAYEEGLDPASREFRRRLKEVTPADRFTRRPQPMNHLLPPAEGSPRQTDYDRAERDQKRKMLEPKFQKTVRDP